MGEKKKKKKKNINMYKLPCPDNVLYLEWVGKQPPLGTGTKVGSLRPATGMRYIRTTGTMSTSQLLCDLISVTAEAPYLAVLAEKYIHHKDAASPAQLLFFL